LNLQDKVIRAGADRVEATTMARPVRVRASSADEDAALLRIVRGGGRQDTIRVRRAVMVRASAHGANLR